MIYNQTVWNFARSKYKTNTRICTKAPYDCTKQAVSKNTEKTESRVNKIDCTEIRDIINSEFYYLDGECVINSKIDDILHGVSRLDTGGNSRPLSKFMLFTLFNEGGVIYLKDIQEIVGCGVRQAQRYLKALKISERMIINLQ